MSRRRRSLLRKLRTIAIVVFSGAGLISSVASARLPNFVVIMVDDLGAEELPSYGHSTHRTPHLDQLACEGKRYRTCYATPNCSPTRIMLMTGRFGFRTGWFDFLERPNSPAPGSPQFDIGQAEITFADVLKPLGYVTGITGKWQLPGSPSERITDCGFDTHCMWRWKHALPDIDPASGEDRRPWNPSASLHAAKKTNRYWHPGVMQDGRAVPTSEDDYGPDIFTDYACDYIQQNKDHPFLLYYPMVLCHNHGGGLPGVPDLRNPGQKTEDGLAPNVEYIDHLVGRIDGTLDALGLRDETWLIFTTDNGTADDGKGEATERGARVPLIVRGPGVVPGTVSDDLTSLADIFPTIVELAAAELPDCPIDGVSLVPSLRDRSGPRREWTFSYLGDKRVLRDQRWLLEGDGTFYDCGTSRDGRRYRDVTRSNNSDVVAARKRFDEILKGLPGPAVAARSPNDQ